jgi:dUTP pyrophosphatase
MPTITVKKLRSDAVLPTKAHDSDIGYDLTLVSLDSLVVNSFHGGLSNPETFMYDTGIAVQPESGYYVEVVPRSSLAKSGFILANSVGIIDPDYRGSIKVALMKIDINTKELPLPFKGLQLIVRKVESTNIVETSGELTQTQRNDGGFGSTNFRSETLSVQTGHSESRTGKNRRGGSAQALSSLGETIE